MSVASLDTNQTDFSKSNQPAMTNDSDYLDHFTSMRYPFAGMIRDVRLRLPYYLSDWKIALSYRILAATIRIFFLNTIPALAYAFDLYLRSDHYYGVNEALLASALGGEESQRTFSILSSCEFVRSF